MKNYHEELEFIRKQLRKYGEYPDMKGVSYTPAFVDSVLYLLYPHRHFTEKEIIWLSDNLSYKIMEA